MNIEQLLRNAIAQPVAEAIESTGGRIDEAGLIPNGTLIYKMVDGRIIRVLLVVEEPRNVQDSTTIFDPGSK